VTLVYGERDWSRPPEREANLALLRGARSITLADTGHFAALEQPARVAEILLEGTGASGALGQRLMLAALAELIDRHPWRLLAIALAVTLDQVKRSAGPERDLVRTRSRRS
jgi:hypothetical protein